MILATGAPSEAARTRPTKDTTAPTSVRPPTSDSTSALASKLSAWTLTVISLFASPARDGRKEGDLARPPDRRLGLRMRPVDRCPDDVGAPKRLLELGAARLEP